jgi:hypothetical protein
VVEHLTRDAAQPHAPPKRRSRNKRVDVSSCRPKKLPNQKVRVAWSGLGSWEDLWWAVECTGQNPQPFGRGRVGGCQIETHCHVSLQDPRLARRRIERGGSSQFSDFACWASACVLLSPDEAVGGTCAGRRRCLPASPHLLFFPISPASAALGIASVILSVTPCPPPARGNQPWYRLHSFSRFPSRPLIDAIPRGTRDIRYANPIALEKQPLGRLASLFALHLSCTGLRNPAMEGISRC